MKGSSPLFLFLFFYARSPYPGEYFFGGQSLLRRGCRLVRFIQRLLDLFVFVHS